jgi:Trk K+ transport system NAD-binding subunit
VRHLRDHIVAVGLGSFGIRVASDLKAAGHDVAAIERNEDNRLPFGRRRTRRTGDLR